MLREDQIYRIDHFLGKETVQSIMAVRFANGFFEPIWNRDHIDHVQITAAETVGVERRGQFYEQTGALRDMVPNHLFQLLTMIAMEPPTSFDPDAVRNRKADVLNAIPPCVRSIAPCAANTAEVKFADSRSRIIGTNPTSPRHSPIETYVALKLEIDSWRWAGVPFYLRTGKSMSKRWTEIAIQFRRAPLSIFQGTDVSQLAPNWLVLQIPAGRRHLFAVPGQAARPDGHLGAGQKQFRLQGLVPAAANVGYETLIYDCMIGDATLFQRADMVEAGWRIVQPVLDGWGSEKPRRTFPITRPAAPARKRPTNLLADDGRAWLPIGDERKETPDAQDFAVACRRRRHAGHGAENPDRTRASRRRCPADRGIRFAITSGRPPRGMAMLIEPLALTTPIAGFNGGVFVRPDLSVIETRTLAPDVARQAIDIIESHGMDAWLYTGTDWQIHKKDAPHVAREAWTVKFDADRGRRNTATPTSIRP